MQTGQIIHTFTAKDGRDVILRTPKWEDIDDLLLLINSLIDENADIWMREQVTRNEQIDWLSRRLTVIEKGQVIQIVAEVKGHVIANTDVKIKTGLRSHVGDIGIIIKQGYRDIGIGTEMLKQLIIQAQERNLKILTMDVFASNTRAKHVYEKLGFCECGRIPGEIFKNGWYIDHITMVKVLDETIKFSTSPRQA
jgi:RimJ/RimL family protein N-acetyltransferase